MKKPFNLEAAKRGEPLITRGGDKARFVAHVPEACAECRLICLIQVLKGESLGLSKHEIYAVLDQASNFGDYLSSQVIRQGQMASSEEVLH